MPSGPAVVSRIGSHREPTFGVNRLAVEEAGERKERRDRGKGLAIFLKERKVTSGGGAKERQNFAGEEVEEEEEEEATRQTHTLSLSLSLSLLYIDIPARVQGMKGCERERGAYYSFSSSLFPSSPVLGKQFNSFPVLGISGQVSGRFSP